ncbi:hypothetical protein Nepgr_005072 [Nepenthes gracilis]|uniref:Uncharacterized protein n=1 Tax=Nepenthes gracilis TaxID=150966 RepID=A0AAD3S2M1_NEPGR|nr:hypothetical protein Nepgr_005072 [Nepenthes gracilis]
MGWRAAFPVVEAIAKRLWDTSGLIQVLTDSRGCFYLMFSDVSCMCNVCEDGPWTMAGMKFEPMADSSFDANVQDRGATSIGAVLGALAGKGLLGSLTSSLFTEDPLKNGKDVGVVLVAI